MKFNKTEVESLIDEIIYEAVAARNPFKDGDLVKLRPDALGRFPRNVPAHAGFTKNQFAWRETLRKLSDKTGKISRVFPNSKQVSVTFPDKWKSKDEHGREYEVDTIGIDYTELIPADKPEGGTVNEVNYTTDKSTGEPRIAVGAPNSVARFAIEHPDTIKAMRDWAKDVQWRDVEDESDIDDMSDIDILKGVEKHYEGGVKQFIQDSDPTTLRDEGYGYVHAKDRAKDPKSIKKPGGGTEHWRIKYQSTSDLKKHGNTEKSPVNESISVDDIRNVIRELLSEMWTGWEEDVKEAADFYSPDDDYFGAPPQIPGAEKLSMAKPKKEMPKIQKLPPAPKSNETPEQLRARLLAKLYGKTNEGDKLKKKVVGESGNPDRKYIIWAKSGPSTVYYVSSQTQGERMIQNAQSMATKFDTEEQVRRKILQLRQKYKGISKFDFEIVSATPGWEDVWKPHGPKIVNLGNQVFKPVKKGDEYVVRWAVDGKTDEGKTYYTDDRGDANDTYLAMIKQAKELNSQGNSQGLTEKKLDKCYIIFAIKDDGEKEYLGENPSGSLIMLPNDQKNVKDKAIRYKSEEEVRKNLNRLKSTMHRWKWDFEPANC